MKMMMFCSNPVNGGTARVFYELFDQFECHKTEADTYRACVNINNPVEVYQQIEQLDRLAIYSEEEICAKWYGSKSVLGRVVNRLIRKMIYFPMKRKNIATMKAYIEKNQFDCVMIHNGGYVGDDLCNQMLTAAYRCKRFTIRRIMVFHSDMKKSFLLRLRYFGYDKKIAKEATKIITVSNFTKNRIANSSFIKKKIDVIPNGLSEKNELTKEEKREQILVDPEKKNILMIGNYQMNKGQDHFIESAHLVLKKQSNVHFYLIGNIYDQSYFEMCKEIIRQYGIAGDFTVIHGINNAAEYIDLFDVIVIPSLFDESFGLIAAEAMAKGVPVVAYACGGIPEVIEDGKDGFLIAAGDYEMMAERIEWLLGHDAERIRMGQCGRSNYENKYAVEVMYRNYRNCVR